MPVFETPRLIVRSLSHHDLPALTAILSDPQVVQYSIRGVCDEQATAQLIDWCLGCYASHGMGPWALEDKASAELVGFCGVAPETVAGFSEFEALEFHARPVRLYRLQRQAWSR